MEAKELMVNDRVFENTYLKKNCTVQVVEPDRVLLKEGKCYSMPNEIEPIPFAEEIFEKNGFTDVGDCIYQNEEQCCGVELNTFMFYVYVNDYDNDNCHDVAQVFYVHQLQHALRLVGLDNVADNLKV